MPQVLVVGVHRFPQVFGIDSLIISFQKNILIPSQYAGKHFDTHSILPWRSFVYFSNTQNKKKLNPLLINCKEHDLLLVLPILFTRQIISWLSIILPRNTKNTIMMIRNGKTNHFAVKIPLDNTNFYEQNQWKVNSPHCNSSKRNQNSNSGFVTEFWKKSIKLVPLGQTYQEPLAQCNVNSQFSLFHFSEITTSKCMHIGKQFSNKRMISLL